MKHHLLLYLLFFVFVSSAQQSVNVRTLEDERKATLAAIEETNRLLNENKRTTSNALNRLSLLNQQLSSRKNSIRLLNQEISSIDENIRQKEMLIKSFEKDLDTKKQQYAASLKKMYENKKNQNNLLFILSSENFTQSYHRMMYLKAFSGWQKKQTAEIIEKQNKIKIEKEKLVAQRNEKSNLLGERKTEENLLSAEEATQKAEVKTLESNKKKLQDELEAKQKQANALNREIDKIIAEEVSKAARAAKTSTGETRTAEIKGGYAMTEKERVLSSTFVGNKGKLPFPVRGTYKVVGFFGVNKHKELKNIETNNNGIDIQTTAGNEAIAVFEGVVSRVFTFPGYNNSVIIRHGNYLTFYANLDQVYVKQGDRVNTRQPIGKIYTDIEKGNSTILHFEMRKEETKLNPLEWIR